MWTIIWTDADGRDHCERFDYKDDLYKCVSDNNLFDDEDTMIFPPEADDLMCSAPWMDWN